MRAFATFHVRPFLWAGPQGEQELRKAFFDLSRKYHPDRFVQASEEEQRQAEAISSRVNADYPLLKDTWRLLESVAEASATTAAGAKTSAPPPAFALEYFELQEELADKGPEDAGLREAARKFAERLRGEQKALETTVLAFAQRFPFSGFGDEPAAWTEKDLAELRALMEKLRYLKSFARDFAAKFPGTT